MKFRALQLVFAISLMPAMVWATTRESRSNDRPEKAERSTPAQSSVTVSLCVQSSNVTVRGWDKDEVMAQSMEGALIQFKRDAADESTPASRVDVLVVDKEDSRRTEYRCQASTDLQIRVPMGATVHIQTRDGNIEITDVGMAYAGSQDGDIVLEKISAGAEVGTIGGNITVSDSTGRMDLNSVGGNVVACEVRPKDPSESFESSTVSGNIELTEVGHAIMNVRTTTGNTILTGPLAAAGKYAINSMSGNVTLALPSDSSFQLNAKISSNGEIITDFPLTLLSQSVSTSQTKPGKAAKATAVSQVPPAGPQGGAAAQTPPPTPAVQVPTPGTPSPAPVAAPTTPQPPSAPQPETPVVVKVEPKISVVIPQEAMIVKVKPADIKIFTGHTLRRVSAVCGTGDATISVASFSGTLHLQKSD